MKIRPRTDSEPFCRAQLELLVGGGDAPSHDVLELGSPPRLAQ